MQLEQNSPGGIVMRNLAGQQVQQNLKTCAAYECTGPGMMNNKEGDVKCLNNNCEFSCCVARSCSDFTCDVERGYTTNEVNADAVCYADGCEKNCCNPPTCEGYVCADSLLTNSADPTEECFDGDCATTCCAPYTCGDYTCTTEGLSNFMNATLECGGDEASCEAICCAQKTCGDHICLDDSTENRADANKTCSDEGEDACELTCCLPKVCTGYACNSTLDVNLHIDAVPDVLCDGDCELTCCGAATCGNYECLDESYENLLDGNVTCQLGDCEVSCCTPRVCLNHVCELPLYNDADGAIVCNGDCENLCCAERTCETFACPDGAVRLPLYEGDIKTCGPDGDCEAACCTFMTCDLHNCTIATAGKIAGNDTECEDTVGCDDACCEKMCVNHECSDNSTVNPYYLVDPMVACGADCEATCCSSMVCDDSVICDAGTVLAVYDGSACVGNDCQAACCIPATCATHRCSEPSLENSALPTTLCDGDCDLACCTAKVCTAELECGVGLYMAEPLGTSCGVLGDCVDVCCRKSDEGQSPILPDQGEGETPLCTAYTCATGFVSIGADAPCPDGDCDKCCEATCATHLVCTSAGATNTADPTEVCGANCDSICCSASTCGQHTCDGDTVKVGAEATVCVGAACAEECCMTVTCSTIDCTETVGFVAAADATSETVCPKGDCSSCCDATCASHTCAVEGAQALPDQSTLCGDVGCAETCCSISQCSTHTCADGFALIAAAAETTCNYGECETTCCEEETAVVVPTVIVPTCASHTCKVEGAVKTAADTVECGDDCEETCCDILTCADHICEDEFAYKLPTDDTCGANGCEITCCLSITCAVHECETGSAVANTTQECPQGDCTACCESVCDQYECTVDGALNVANATEFCGELGCEETCCDRTSCAEHLQCSNINALQDTSNTTFCTSEGCDATCCKDVFCEDSCANLVGFIPVEGTNASTPCPGGDCAACCVATCASVEKCTSENAFVTDNLSLVCGDNCDEMCCSITTCAAHNCTDAGAYKNPARNATECLPEECDIACCEVVTCPAECPTSFAKTAEVVCPKGDCSACCAPTCALHTECSVDGAKFTNDTTKICGTGEDNDCDDICCDVVTCDSHICETLEAYNPGAATVCPDGECADACCFNVTCAMHAENCEAGYVVTDADALCPQGVCDGCCVPTCETVTECPVPGAVMSANLSTICGPSCAETCCSITTCSEHICSDLLAFIDPAKAAITCPDAERCDEACCEIKTCASLEACPDNFVAVDPTTVCPNGVCDACCTATCASHECMAPTVKTANDTVLCPEEGCGATCCSMPVCDSVVCDVGQYSLNQGLPGLECPNGDCANCCINTCASHNCTHANNDLPLDTQCGDNCGDVCCRDLTCGDHTCEAGFFNTGTDADDCINGDCSACCLPLPTCATHTCASVDAMVNQNLTKPCLLEEDGGCEAACCYNATCADKPCTGGMVLIQTNDTSCPQGDCSACCDVSCGMQNCTAPSLLTMPADFPCGGAELCQATCCSMPVCDAQVCDPGFVKINNGTLGTECPDGNCNACCVRTCAATTCPHVDLTVPLDTVCGPDCAEVCCRDPTCADHDCHDPFAYKQPNATEPCGASCEETCCANVTCADIPCLENHVPLQEANTTCPYGDCSACCAPTCASHTCLNPDAVPVPGNTTCENGDCALTCCSEATCGGVVCEDGYLNSMPDNTVCVGGDCPGTCCSIKRCTDYICNNTYALHNNQSEPCLPEIDGGCEMSCCKDVTCADKDCALLDVPGFVMVEDPLTPCPQGDCSACCAPTCLTHVCAEPLAFRNNETLLCDGDCEGTCCMNVTCQMFLDAQPIPVGLALVKDAAELCESNDCMDCFGLTCASHNCTDPFAMLPDGITVDSLCGVVGCDETCCDTPMCDEAVCAPGTVNPNAALTVCPNGNCTECCVATCELHECSHPDAAINGTAATICGDDCDRVCCEIKECDEILTCPPNFIHVEAGANCPEGDCAQCCQPTCDSHVCGNATDAKLSDNTTACPDGDCEANCCKEVTCADAPECAAGFVSLPGAEEMVCPGGDCSMCCQATCASHNCTHTDEDSTHNNILSLDTLCGASCSQTCCVVPTCEAVVCPVGYINNGTAEQDCEDLDCVASCCVPTCASHTCNATDMVNPKLDTMCAGGTAEGCAESCCKEVTCDMRPCVEPQILTALPETICPLGICADICCSNTCAGHTCPAPQVKTGLNITVCNDETGTCDELCCSAPVCDAVECAPGYANVEAVIPGTLCPDGDCAACCKPTCNSHTCASPDAMKNPNLTMVCGAGGCEQSCCYNMTCADVTCEAPEVQLLPNTTSCPLADCSTCCGTPVCDTQVCDVDHVNINNGELGVACPNGDCAQCCSPTCAAMTCAHRNDTVPLTTVCGGDCADICCRDPTCGDYDCINVNAMKNKDEVLCGEGGCETTCCANVTCADQPCENLLTPGYALVQELTTECPLGDCGACCAPTCESITCKTEDFPLMVDISSITNKNETFCVGGDCRLTCCEVATCFEYLCAEDTINLDPTSVLPCAGSGCQETCCKPLTCADHTCNATAVVNTNLAQECALGVDGGCEISCCAMRTCADGAIPCADGFVQAQDGATVCPQGDCSECCAATCASTNCTTPEFPDLVRSATVPSTTACGDLGCNATCCETLTCGGFECPGDYENDFPAIKVCAGGDCFASCCGHKGTCGAYDCINPLAMKETNGDVVCAADAEGGCEATCCPVLTCANATCPVDYLSNPKLDTPCPQGDCMSVCCAATCATANCTLADVNAVLKAALPLTTPCGPNGCLETCCEGLTCGAHVCPVGHVAAAGVLPESACPLGDCSSCCEPTCATTTCTTPELPNFVRNLLVLDTEVCVGGDCAATCCEERTCEFHSCQASFDNTALAATVCVGGDCDATCCTPLGTCATHVCLNETLAMRNLDETPCNSAANGGCEANCCAIKTCANDVCPALHVAVAAPETICPLGDCTACCAPSCASVTCDPLQFLAPIVAPQDQCPDGDCTQCCGLTCASVSECGADQIKQKADTELCGPEGCEASCCHTPTCDRATCPATYLKTVNDATPCAGGNCTETCCSPTCASLSECKDKDAMRNPILTTQCLPEEQGGCEASCCAIKICAQEACAPGTAYKVDNSTVCPQGICPETCCGPSCDTETCEGLLGYVNVEPVGTVCPLGDCGKCCTATCATHTCGTPDAIKFVPDITPCVNGDCETTCCAAIPCAGQVCPAGYINDAPAEEMCAGGDCNSCCSATCASVTQCSNQNASVPLINEAKVCTTPDCELDCCVVATCAMATCGVNDVRMPDETECLGGYENCAATCCQPSLTCAAHTCAPMEMKNPDPAALCVGTDCSVCCKTVLCGDGKPQWPTEGCAPGFMAAQAADAVCPQGDCTGCCKPVAMCTGYQCTTPGYQNLLADGLNPTECAGGDALNCEASCCTEIPTCATHACTLTDPPVVNFRMDGTICSAEPGPGSCDAICCAQVCDSYTCDILTPGNENQVNGFAMGMIEPGLVCVNGDCEATCCKTLTCGTLTEACPVGTTKKDNLAPCILGNCAASCCEVDVVVAPPQPLCDTTTCGPNTVKRAGLVVNQPCNDCQNECCQAQLTCNSIGCPQGSQKILGQELSICVNCEQECCEPIPVVAPTTLCGNTVCGGGFQLIAVKLSDPCENCVTECCEVIPAPAEVVL